MVVWWRVLELRGDEREGGKNKKLRIQESVAYHMKGNYTHRKQQN